MNSVTHAMAWIRKFQKPSLSLGWGWGGGKSVEYCRALWGSGQFHKDISDILPPPTPPPLTMNNDGPGLCMHFVILIRYVISFRQMTNQMTFMKLFSLGLELFLPSSVWPVVVDEVIVKLKENYQS